MTADDDLHFALRVGALGTLPTEAGVELLIRHGRAVHADAPWLRDAGDGRVSVDTGALLDAAASWPATDRQVARVACWLLGGEKVSLDEELQGLDERGVALVTDAVSYAAGLLDADRLAVARASNPAYVEDMTARLKEADAAITEALGR